MSFTETNQVIALDQESRTQLHGMAVGAALGFSTLRTAVQLSAQPSLHKPAEAQARLDGAIQRLFNNADGFDTEAELYDLLQERYPISSEGHVRNALTMLGGVSEFMHHWNSTGPLSGVSASVRAKAFYQRAITSVRLEKRDESRWKRLILPDISLRVLRTGERGDQYELAIASSPELPAQLQTELDTDKPLVNRVFRPHVVGGLAVSCLDLLDGKMVVPEFRIVEGTLANTYV